MSFNSSHTRSSGIKSNKRVAQFQFLLGILSCFSLFAPTSHAKEDTEFLIQSPFDGTTPYQVIRENQNSSYTKAPGLYSSNLANGKNWELLIPGNVLLTQDHTPFLMQLELTQFDQRHEAFGVVDGSLYLFQNKSSTKEIQLIKMGEGTGTVGLFPLGPEVRLPLIQTLDDLVIEPCPVISKDNERGQLIGVSIRCSQDCNPHYNGGVSFMLMVPQGVPANTATPLLQLIPLATEVDLKFMTHSELRQRFCEPSL